MASKAKCKPLMASKDKEKAPDALLQCQNQEH